MAHRLAASIAGIGAALLLAASTQAQAAAAPAPLAIPNPNYVTLVLEETVNRPAQEVWARVGKYCDISEWFRLSCAITSAGRPDDLGAVRALNNGAVIEMLVAKTDLSYTYTQPVRTGVPFNAYHGTLEAKPVDDKTTRLVYSFFYDNSMVAEDARAAEIANRRARFGDALKNMKILAEGGTLPPPAPTR